MGRLAFTMHILKTAALLAAGWLVVWLDVAPAVAQPQCADLGGTLDQGTCHIHTAADTYTIDVSYPVDYPDQQALTGYLTQTRDGFVNASQMPGTGDLPYQLQIDPDEYHSGHPPHGSASVVLKIFQQVGGPRPATWYKAFNYDLDARRPITFDTLFKPDTKPLDVIYPIVRRQLESPAGQGTEISPGVGLDPSHYQNFAITDDAVIFFFSQGELLPASASTSIAHIPRDAIAGLLALSPPPPP
jgi:hypothetical protein